MRPFEMRMTFSGKKVQLKPFSVAALISREVEIENLSTLIRSICLASIITVCSEHLTKV